MMYEYPLSWPVGVPRTANPKRSLFDTAEERAKRNLEAQLTQMGAADVIITSNVELRRDGRPYVGQRIQDTGIAVYFKRKAVDQCIACDKWNTTRDNLHAIGKTIEALRGIERWGTGSMVDAAFRGFTALPSSASGGASTSRPRPWWEVLGVASDASQDLIAAAYKVALKKTHPDVGGSVEAFKDVQRAFAEATR